MTISVKRRKPFHPSLIFDIVYLKEVESHKHLGIAICNNLSWNPHVKEIIFKGYAKLGQMRKCKYKRILDSSYRIRRYNLRSYSRKSFNRKLQGS